MSKPDQIKEKKFFFFPQPIANEKEQFGKKPNRDENSSLKKIETNENKNIRRCTNLLVENARIEWGLMNMYIYKFTWDAFTVQIPLTADSPI